MDINAAKQRISSYLDKSPTLEFSRLNKAFGARIILKCEQFNEVRAFKLRGALNFCLKHIEDLKSSGVVTHSSGNHGQALAYVAQLLGLKASIVVPENAPEVKVRAMKQWNPELVFCKNSIKDREDTCNRIAQEKGYKIVPPYDHLDIIEGQATSTLELIEDWQIDLLIAPIGGGGLLAGALSAINQSIQSVELYGAEPSLANDAYLGFSSGERVEEQPTPVTIADGLRTTVGYENFEILKGNLNGIFLAEEEDIKDWGKKMLADYNLLIEPSSAVSLAALWKKKEMIKGKTVGVIISGGNVNPTVYL